jgi:hypothetical protein
MRIIRKRGIDLINSHCEKLNKLNTLDSFISLLDIIQISLENDLIFIHPEPNFLRFFKECITSLNGLQLSQFFILFDSLLPSFNYLLIMNSTRLPIALKLKKEVNKTLKTEIEINLTLLESEKYNLNTNTSKTGFNLIQSDFNVEKILNFNQNPFLLFFSELFETEIPPSKEKFKLLLQKVLYGIRSYDVNWSMFPKPKINNFLLRFLIRLFGININLKKLSHWAIPDFLLDISAMFIGLNAKILLVLNDIHKNNSKQTPPELIFFNFENGVIKNLDYINDQDLITEIKQQSLESVRLLISEQYGFISHVLMVDKHLIKKILEIFIIGSHKNPQYFQLNPEIPPYTLLKKKRSISFLKYLLSIVIDKHEF